MMGFYLLFIAGVWIALAFWLSKTIAKRLIQPKRPFIVGPIIFAMLLPLPLIDEILGGRQF
ncbi:MAG: hypothetical protein LBU46_00620 [Candidatus Accumulibacter sp.]|jgi:hypothetical protein|nr:hypothetical protein [Accumulibacter sp.]